MLSRLTVVLVSLLLVALLLQTAAIIWLCVLTLRTRTAELRSDECWGDAGRYCVGSSNTSLTKTSFNFLKHIRKLTIDKQYIPSFGNDTFLSEGLTELEEISVQLSQLRTIELGALNGMTKLKDLSLFGNEISEILPGTFEKTRRLQYLSLGNNSIEHLHIGVFSGLISLISLDLSRNKLHYVYPNTFFALPNLKTLLLRYNPGLQVPTDRNFINSHTLLHLSIAYCKASSVSVETFANVTALEWLELSYNNLKNLDINIFRALPELNTLYLYGNPLHCDCQLQEVWWWCEDRNIETVEGSRVPECDTPSEVKGMTWGVLEKLQCSQGNVNSYVYYNNTNYNYTAIQETRTDTFTEADTEI